MLNGFPSRKRYRETHTRARALHMYNTRSGNTYIAYVQCTVHTKLKKLKKRVILTHTHTHTRLSRSMTMAPGY